MKLLVRAPNILGTVPMGGAEYVIYNWLKRFSKTSFEIIPDVDLQYQYLCTYHKLDRNEVIKKLEESKLPINERVLKLYLDCRLSSEYSVMSRELNDQLVLDLNVGGYEIPLDNSRYLLYVKDIMRRAPVGYRFLKYAMKFSKKYIGFLQHLGTLVLDPSLYLRNLFKARSYTGGFMGVLELLFVPQVVHSSWKNLLKKHKDKARLLSTSEGVFEKTGLTDVPHRTVFPIVAFELDTGQYVTRDKESYAVFFARPDKMKGLIEAVNVFKAARERGCLDKLYIIGGSVDENLIRGLGLERSVVNLGRLPNKSDVYKVVSKASVSIYPSISDTFGITVLETIALNTPVVMYYNPANYEIFSKSNLIKTVPVFDRKAMVDAVCEVATNPVIEPNDYTRKLIEQHKNWDRVVPGIENAILQLVET